MDIPAVGAHCSLATCNVNDFLPIRCQCERLFCRSHISPDLHACPLLDAHSNAQLQTSTDPSQRLERCAFETCDKPSLESFLSSSTKGDSSFRTPAVCPSCSKAFCATHREPNSHACTPSSPTSTLPQKNEAARALLAKHFPSTSNSTTSAPQPSRTTKPPTNPKKAAQLRQVQLMKMRHRAQPADPRDKDNAVPLDQKLHVLVRAEGSKDENPYWIRKTTVTGKVLDLLSARFRLSATASNPLHLLQIAGEETKTLRNDLPICDQVEDGSVLFISK